MGILMKNNMMRQYNPKKTVTILHQLLNTEYKVSSDIKIEILEELQRKIEEELC